MTSEQAEKTVMLDGQAVWELAMARVAADRSFSLRLALKWAVQELMKQHIEPYDLDGHVTVKVSRTTFGQSTTEDVDVTYTSVGDPVPHGSQSVPDVLTFVVNEPRRRK